LAEPITTEPPDDPPESGFEPDEPELEEAEDEPDDEEHAEMPTAAMATAARA
jgi:hypothetical protein